MYFSVTRQTPYPTTVKARCHYQSFPSKTLSKKTWTNKTWTKCLLALSKCFDHLCQRIGGKSCKHETMAPTLTNYENIVITLCLMSIVILRRRLRDRARGRRRATRSWLLRRKQRSAYNTLLKELHNEDPNEFRNYFRMDKTTIQSILLWFHLSIWFLTHFADFPFPALLLSCAFVFVNIISSFQNSILIGWFPSKSIKGWRKIGWSSIPSKLVKVFDQRFLWLLSLSKFHQTLTKKTLIVTTGL